MTRKDLFTSGAAWIHLADGVVVRTELAATAEPEIFAYYNLDYGTRPQRRLARR